MLITIYVLLVAGEGCINIFIIRNFMNTIMEPVIYTVNVCIGSVSISKAFPAMCMCMKIATDPFAGFYILIGVIKRIAFESMLGREPVNRAK
jgi:hypothetical protein